MTRVLIIDDDQFILKVYQQKFDAEGLSAAIAADAASALARIRESPPDLVLLDLLIPGTSGVDILRQIRAYPPAAHTRVVVFSHSYDVTLIESARAAGASAVLNKHSVSPNKLMEVVRQQLSQSPPVPAPAEVAPPPETAAGLTARQRLHESGPATESRLRELVHGFATATAIDTRLAALGHLAGALTDLVAEARSAHLHELARFARAGSAMLLDLEQHPEEIHTGTFASLARLVDALCELQRRIPVAPDEPELPQLVVVVIDPADAAALVAEAFHFVRQPAVCFPAPAAARDFLTANPAALLVASAAFAPELWPAARDLPKQRELRALFLGSEPHVAGQPTPLIGGEPVLLLPYSAEEVALNGLVRTLRR
jgi:two-component system phosphate regulon response regulator PhoB